MMAVDAQLVVNLFPMTRSKKLRKAQYEILAAFRYALRRFIHFSETAAQAANITPQQHQALLAIKGFPGCDRVTVGELAERLQLRHHSTVGLIDRLALEKLVARASSKEDRRQVFVQLTNRGKKTLEKLSALHHEQLKRIGPELSQLLNRLDGAAPCRTKVRGRHLCGKQSKRERLKLMPKPLDGEEKECPVQNLCPSY
jgi:DNA-binding MarR family transcriptional regulator